MKHHAYRINQARPTHDKNLNFSGYRNAFEALLQQEIAPHTLPVADTPHGKQRERKSIPTPKGLFTALFQCCEQWTNADTSEL